MWKSVELNSKWNADSDTSRFVLLAIWSFSLLITAGLFKTAAWLAAIAVFFIISSVEKRREPSEKSKSAVGWGELGIVGVWGFGPILVYLSNHPEKLTVAVIMLVCGFLIVLGRYRNSARPAFIVSAPYILLTVWFLYQAFGTEDFIYLSIMAVMIFGTFVTMTAFSVRTHKKNVTMMEEKERLIRELDQARESAEKIAQFKSEFLASMSHEIRTPLTGVVGMADMIIAETQETVSKNRATTIVKCGRSLMNLINDILDLAKIQADGMTINLEPYDIRAELKSVSDLWRIPAEQKGLVFELKVDPETPIAQFGDIHRIKQCLNNLIGNAVKFTETGSVQVYVTGKAHKDRNYLVFSVKDTGPGVAAEFEEDLFAPFKQSASVDPNKTSGTGLGLSITRELSELMGGGVKYQPNADQGSQFVFWIKTRAGKPQDGEIAGSAYDTEFMSSYAGRTVLIVDDIQHNIDVLEQLIRSLGGSVYTAVNGEEALEKLSIVDVDLIFMDVRMPVMDGFEATRAIRKLEPGKAGIPIIAYSGVALKKDRQYYINLGMDDHLPKPFTRQQVIELASHFDPDRAALKQSA